MVPLLPAARLRLSPVARAVGLALLALPTLCAAETDAAVVEQLERLSERLQQVEKRNDELERRVRELTPTAGHRGRPISGRRPGRRGDRRGHRHASRAPNGATACRRSSRSSPC